jgi:hypothetical protein
MTNDQFPMTNGGGAAPVKNKMGGARRALSAIWILSFVICHSPAPSAAAAAPVGAPPARVVYLFRDSLWSADPDGTRPRSLTKGMAVYAYDVTFDGQRVAFAAGTWRGDRKRRELVESEIWVINADGTDLRRLVAPIKAGASHSRVGQMRWSPNGQSLAFDLVGESRSGPNGGTLYVLRLSEGTARRAASELVTSFAWTATGEITYRTVRQSPAQPGASSPSPAMSRTAAPPLPPDAVPQPQPSLPAQHPAGAPATVSGPGSRGVGAGAD